MKRYAILGALLAAAVLWPQSTTAYKVSDSSFASLRKKVHALEFVSKVQAKKIAALEQDVDRLQTTSKAHTVGIVRVDSRVDGLAAWAKAMTAWLKTRPTGGGSSGRGG